MIMELPPGVSFAAMTLEEIAELGAWAAGEGWNPGRNDLSIAHGVDPDAFIALREGETLVGGGSVFSYGGRFGFLGLFIMRREYRNRGLGGALWRHLIARSKERVREGAVGLDGVFAMIPYYEKSGFRQAYRHIRFQGVAAGAPDAGVMRDVGDFLADILVYDRPLFPAPREKFLARWVAQPGAHVAGLYEKGKLAGYGVARPCLTGYKIGPLAANDPLTAHRLLSDLMARVASERIQIDMPDVNVAAMALAERFGFKQVFGCVRMYGGPAPDLPVDRIFGVTSLEFG
ncbi:GNAT family N-acetyltransferase [Methylocystis parvus]|uniref:GNAT family N-acetyltransferase n=1 Tax=Methylocystis parvus TaxID=134 RepID=A0A6B8M421_9HYPH|nr:GNAT family N-acetyltransferase [Methylocystis parvus]QGM98644.1 GNAT family N-acetyltransferase [Methylocystis parvus]WBK01008.1 GNAT family N-acetyltransferase [Methylocystis parvus OBBP]